MYKYLSPLCALLFIHDVIVVICVLGCGSDEGEEVCETSDPTFPPDLIQSHDIKNYLYVADFQVFIF